eukprot:1463541-Amphidinium_carterae.1
MDCYWDSSCTEETRATKALLQAQRRAREQRLRSSQGAIAAAVVETDTRVKAQPGRVEVDASS